MSIGSFDIDIDTVGNLKPLNQVVFSLGSNIGESADLLQQAVNRLVDTPNIFPVDISSVYLTKPVENVHQPDFLNIVLIADSILEPQTLIERCQTIEEASGRQRDPNNPKGPRTLDIDLIQVGKRTENTPNLVLPHPRAKYRAFVLVPWLEIEPDAKLAGESVAELVAGLDTSSVRKLDDIKIEIS